MMIMWRFVWVSLWAGMAGVTAMPAGAKDKPVVYDDLKAKLEEAKQQQKLLFVDFGREACGNCRVLHELIEGRDLRLSSSKFIVANLNCDDPATKKLFYSKFKVEGKTLPFVVIADPDGNQLVSRSGYGTAKEYNDLIKEARKAYKKGADDAND